MTCSTSTPPTIRRAPPRTAQDASVGVPVIDFGQFAARRRRRRWGGDNALRPPGTSATGAASPGQGPAPILWYVAIAVLVLWVLGFFMRGASGRWYRW
ncbi:hypothetical protein ACFYV5_10055 [Streptomyces sp. NPDC003035]|uniref:hypothetical protein n=1 Tax=Streptomyces sp. NPDC003035 TaxID=3364676 RepID=UPI0036B9C18B